jgi:hypothetical protein
LTSACPDRLTWIAKAEGGRTGFRYDPDMGQNPQLSCTASGHAWLLTLTDEKALALVSQQGFGSPKEYGPKAPITVKALLGFLHAARVRGYAMIDEVFAPGMASVAVPVQRSGRPASAVISIAGPRARLTPGRMQVLGCDLVAARTGIVGLEQRVGTLFEAAAGKGVNVFATSLGARAAHTIGDLRSGSDCCWRRGRAVVRNQTATAGTTAGRPKSQPTTVLAKK